MWKQMIGVGAVTLGLATTSHASLVTGFETADHPDYVVGETVHGLDGWSVPGNWDTTPSSAVVVDSPVASGSQALQFRRQDPGRGARLARQFDAVAEDSVEVSMSLGWGRTGLLENVTSWLYVGSNSLWDVPGNAAVAIGFKHISDDGAKPVYFHYYDGSEEVRLEVAQPVEDEYYDVVAVLDMTTGTYDLSIIGSNIDITIENLGFRQANTSDISTIMMLNNSRDTWMWLDDVSIVPEPGAMTLLGLGALAMLRRRQSLT